jgi:hypothetical protein
MQYITATQLRTKAKDLFDALAQGRTVNLVKGSKVVGEARPKTYDPKPFDPIRFVKIVKKLNFPKLSNREIERKYRKAMMEKHEPSVS